MTNWTDVEKDPDYLNLPEPEKQKVKKNLWDTEYSKSIEFNGLPKEEKIKAYNGFFNIKPSKEEQAKQDFDNLDNKFRKEFTQLSAIIKQKKPGFDEQKIFEETKNQLFQKPEYHDLIPQYGEKPIGEPEFDPFLGGRTVSNAGAGVIQGATLGLVDPRQGLDIQTKTPLDRIMGVTGQTLGGFETGGRVLSPAIGLATKGITNPNVVNVVSRALLGGTMAGTRPLVDYAQGKGSFKDMAVSIGIGAGENILNIVPEALIKPGINNLIGQVGTQVTADVLAKVMTKQNTWEDLKKPEFWANEGINTVPAFVSAIDGFLGKKQYAEPIRTQINNEVKAVNNKTKQLDIIPKPLNYLQKITGIVNTPKGELTRSIVGEEQAKLDNLNSKEKEVGREKVNMWYKNFNTQQHLAFIDNIEKGLNTPARMMSVVNDPKIAVELSDLAKGYRARLDIEYDLNHAEDKTDEAYKEKQGYIEDYFPHIWEKPTDAQKFFSNYMSSFKSRPAFMKERVIDFIHKGIEAGLKLKTTNPEEIIEMREQAGNKYRMKKEIEKRLKEEGILKFIKFGEALPQGAIKLNDPSFKVMFPGKEGMVQTGEWVASTEDAGNLLNNWLSHSAFEKGFGKNFYQSIMNAKSLLLPVRLMGLYHFQMTDYTSMGTSLSLGFRNFGRGQGIEMLKNFAMAIPRPFIAQLPGKFGMGQYIKAYYKGATTEEQNLMIGLMNRANFNPKGEKGYSNIFWEDVQRAWWQGKHVEATLKTFPAVMKTLAYPLMDYWVPRLKMQSFKLLAEDYLKNNTHLSEQEKTAGLQLLSRNIDNRMGQMNLDNMFWHRTLRDIGVMSTLSLGWQIGDIRDFGGVLVDTYRAGKQVGKNFASGERLGKDVDITDKMTFIPAYLLTVMMIGATKTFMNTGKPPKKVKDYFYPLTLQKNRDGSTIREALASEWKDVFGLIEAIKSGGLIGGAVRFVLNKANPLISDISDLIMNKDYFNIPIRDDEAPYGTQALQVLKWWGQENLPFGIQSSLAAKKMGGKINIDPLIGFPLAPGSINRSATQSAIYDTYNKLTKKAYTYFDEGTVSKAETELRNLYTNDKNAWSLKSAEYHKVLTQHQINNTKDQRPPDVMMFKRMEKSKSPWIQKKIKKIIAGMTDEEKERYGVK